jgi:hypothetical protein
MNSFASAERTSKHAASWKVQSQYRIPRPQYSGFRVRQKDIFGRVENVWNFDIPRHGRLILEEEGEEDEEGDESEESEEDKEGEEDKESEEDEGKRNRVPGATPLLCSHLAAMTGGDFKFVRRD